ncbi:uncharacterized protein (TIGR00369 family) [Ulvibacter sp. MAR_2010_11]|uniref:PaaI family thioesterase n=1 Tax=Ulvibacter sp. MAR_2010_11 TaxID=1250229 RepID=UPI000C2BB9ED|nr:PaaI family thioesterase [Ulvibacter sp. MAR_2010_11]PKA83133.1 uncharacterized protein (TIGR00369 family) [Ulvibacter sp. MAR_2010_11]
MSHLKVLKSLVGKEFSQSPSPFMRWLNPTLLAVEKGNLIFQYRVRPEWLNPVGGLHGGVTAGIIDDAIGATMYSLDETDYFFTTINNAIDYFSSARSGETVIAETSVIKQGKQFMNAQCNLWNWDRSRLLAKGSSNLFKTEIRTTLGAEGSIAKQKQLILT